MKLMKWMTVTALATVTVFGSFIESANAQFFGGGRKYSGGSDVPDLRFSLVTQTNSGQTIEPTFEKNSFIFKDAVEDFFYLSIPVVLQDKDTRILRMVFDKGDLKVESLKDESIIRYTFFSDSVQPLNPEGLINPVPRQGDVVTFDLDVSDLTPPDQTNFIKSLPFIIENNVLVSESLKEIKLTDQFGVHLVGIDLFGPGRDRFEISDLPQRSATIPEPSTTISLVIVGILGVGFLQKCKL